MLAATIHAGIRPGDRFPPLEEGTPTASGVLLVDFWASWCEPCQASFPVYAGLDRDYRPRGLRIVAVSEDQKPAAYAAFVERMHPTFATTRDKDQQLARLVDVPAMPTCFLIGRDGRVRFVHTGFHGGKTERELRQEIETLLTEKEPSP